MVASVALLAGVLVSAAGALRFNDESYLTPHGVVGVPYFHRFTAPPSGGGGAGCDPPYIVKVDSGELPPRLSLTADGVVSGIPTQPGTWSFWISIKDDPTDKPWCNPMSAEREFTIKVIAGLVIGPESAGPGIVGVPYSLPMTATLSEPKTWSIAAGALPPGLTLGTSSGLISGAPTTVGSYAFTVRAVVDAARSDTKSLTIDVRRPVTIAASTPFAAQTRLARAEVGLAFGASLGATGGSGTYTWSLASGTLPLGVALAVSGAISGRPSAAGVYRFTVAVADTEGRTATYEGTLLVAERLAIVTQRLRPAKVGSPYRSKLAVSGGVNPKSWSKRGVLPPGFVFDRTLGVLSGTPRKAGVYRIRVDLVDALGARSTRTLVVLVRPY
ncbi:MAG: putative Ig domain-containing protein [Actinobacteria bacterium]|nr:putative Ig domain-containing protein [Actinomycetota bacterium]